MARKAAVRRTEPSPEASLAVAAQQLSAGQGSAAVHALLPVLDRRAAEGDEVCGLAAAALRLIAAGTDGIPPPPDPISSGFDRFAALARRQQEQIAALQALVEDLL